MTTQNKTIDSQLVKQVKEKFLYHRTYSLAKDEYTATQRDHFYSLALTIREMMIKKWIDTQQNYYKHNVKRTYYLSLEFLIGRTLGNALINLGIEEECHQALQELGLDFDALRDEEVDAGLGNGGLGRLAACFLDSMATLQLPCDGYSIRYEYGIFRQKFVNGEQIEEPDNWLKNGSPWETERPEHEFTVQFGGKVMTHRNPAGRLCYQWIDTQDVTAVAYEVPVPGYGNATVNTLRLWRSRASKDFNLQEFNRGNYMDAVQDKNLSENISKVLYPNDSTESGKKLRLQQQYFFVSASLQDILRRFMKLNRDEKENIQWEKLADKIAIQLNDTHPAMAIPELMRLLLDEYELDWDRAWALCVKTFAYTNHTLLPEALEKWSLTLMWELFPRHMEIINKINYDFMGQVNMKWPGDVQRLRRMSIIDESGDKYLRMAHLAIVGSHSVNGVAELHSKLLKEDLLREFYEMYPERFNNKTNGITQRRWLLKCNPGLSDLINEKIGNGWVTDLPQLKKLEPFASDSGFQASWQKVKHENKERLIKTIKADTGFIVSPDSLFDVQVKRLHEYKRQLLAALNIIADYIKIKEGMADQLLPRTYIFGAKAAPGYFMAKRIIKLINNVGAAINNDPQSRDIIKVVFLPNYRVSLAEQIFPAADLSEQISLAGKEASGTGNMKFALNGALTIGTLDGANIEIAEEVGEDNIFIFGMKVDEVQELWKRGYVPMDYYKNNPLLKKVIDLIQSDFFARENPGHFQPIIDSLLYDDRFMLLADFQSYHDCQERVSALYRNTPEWTEKSILNSARMGKFSTDRTISQYADEIWGIEACPVE